jgi:chromosome partitioning protein
MKVWAVANQKGGVGKTTTAVNLGGLMAQRGFRTLLIDLDPHGSMSTYFGYNPDTITNSIYTLFRDASNLEAIAPEKVIRETDIENLYLLPSSGSLATLDRQLGAHEGMGLVINKALEAVADNYDYAIIDCPPILGVLMVNALAACEKLLVPVQTEFLAEKGLERMVHTLAMIKRASQKDMPHIIIPTLFDKNIKAAKESLKMLRERYPGEIWDSVIPVDTQFRDASRMGKPLCIMNPTARGAMAYDDLLNTLLGEDDNKEMSSEMSAW